MAKELTEDTLRKRVEKGYKLKELAVYFGVSVSTVKRRLKDAGISLIANRYSSISDDDLETIIRDILSEGHELGEISVDSRLKLIGVTVQRSRIRYHMRNIIPPEQRVIRRIVRRDYYTRAPLSLVHLDSYHKLITWRFVLHGAIDGFSRKVLYLKITDNNRASTVLSFFKNGTYKRMPSRLRIDKGKENTGVVLYFINRRGENRNSVHAGRSVHNTRIERHWRDVKRGATLAYRKLFQQMENAGILDSKSELDLYCLHSVFLPVMKRSVFIHYKSWNLHKHRTLRNKSPNYVFKDAIRKLRIVAKEHRCYFTELDQKNWKKLDRENPIDYGPNVADFEGKVVPRIQCPIDARQDRRLKKWLRNQDVRWRNAVQYYETVKEHVCNLVEDSSLSHETD